VVFGSGSPGYKKKLLSVTLYGMYKKVGVIPHASGHQSADPRGSLAPRHCVQRPRKLQLRLVRQHQVELLLHLC
jgi:hypothetical protein